MRSDRSRSGKQVIGQGAMVCLLTALLVSGCAGARTGRELSGAGVPVAEPASTKAAEGDLVTVGYTLTLEDGALVSTTSAETAQDKGRAKSPWFVMQPRYGDTEVLAGEKGTTPGLGEGVIGMAAGEKKKIRLTPDKAYGTRDAARIRQLPRVNTIPRTLEVKAREYVEKFDSLPKVGKEFPLNPYVTARVAAVGDDDVRLEMLANDGERYKESFGTLVAVVEKEAIKLTIDPEIGAPFDIQGQPGTITAFDAATFTVDCNHPLAGRTLELELDVRSVAKAATFRDAAISWREDHDRALADAAKAGKPVVLVLYAEWCGWCKKLFGESLQDPRVTRLRDRFVWVKVNSNQETEYKTRYGQNGFPMIVMIRPDGSIYRKLDGFRDGAALARELRGYPATTALR